jgi:hypothetical protein
MTKIGIGLAIGFSEEATFGTAAGTVDNYLHTFPGMEAIKRITEKIEGDDLQARGIDSTLVDGGGRMVQGPLAHDAMYGGGWPLFLAQLIGLDPVTAGAGPYTHTFSVGGALGVAADNRAKGITLFIDREGQLGSASTKTAAYKGIKPTAWEIAFAYNQRARISMDLVGQDFSAWGSRLTPTLPSRSWVNSPSQAASPTAFLSYNSTTYVCRGASFRIEQERDLENRDLQSRIPGILQPAGRLKVTGSFTVAAPDTAASSGGAFWDDYNAVTPRAIVLTAEGPTAANESLVATIHKAIITNPGEPEVGGPGTILQTVEFEGYYDAGNSEIASLVLTSADSAAWA